MSIIGDNVRRVQERVARAAQRSGRSADAVQVIAASKTWPAEVLQEAVNAGVRILGENRVQEAEKKAGGIVGPVSWHLIGHLQRNKVKSALGLFDVIHSVDSMRLAREISRLSPETPAQVLVQVNTSGEDSKFGVTPDEALDLVGQISELEGVRVKGLMTIGAFVPDMHMRIVRENFIQLRTLRDRIVEARLPNVSMAEMSMGMTGDFEVAIEEGATMVRVGTAIFGQRTV